LAGLGSTITVVCVVMLACRRDIFREYHQNNNTPPKKNQTGKTV
jgi:hypothetical protein